MTNRCARTVAGTMLALILTVSPGLNAAVVVTLSSLDSIAKALSGKAGSVDGTNTTDPAAVTGTFGNFTNNSFATAGPVAAIPDSIPFPGTTGISTAAATNFLNVTNNSGQIIIDVSLQNQGHVDNMDGGSYFVEARANFSVKFTITAPTPYTLTGTTTWGVEDATAILRLIGTPNLLIGPKDDAPHPFAFSGTLSAGLYEFTGNAGLSETPSPNTGSFAEFSSLVATLVLAPEPASIALLLPGLAALARRRNRRA